MSEYLEYFLQDSLKGNGVNRELVDCSGWDHGVSELAAVPDLGGEGVEAEVFLVLVVVSHSHYGREEKDGKGRAQRAGNMHEQHLAIPIFVSFDFFGKEVWKNICTANFFTLALNCFDSPNGSKMKISSF